MNSRFKPKHVRQCKSTWCVYACICSVEEIDGNYHDQLRISKAIGSQTDEPSGYEIISYFRSRGFELDKKIFSSMDEMEEVAREFRVIVLLNSNTRGHSVVFWKYENGVVYVMDPAVNADVTSFDEAEFRNRMGCCILIKKEEKGDVSE